MKKIVNKINGKLLLASMALMSVTSVALADDPKLLEGLKNADTAGKLTGAAAYTWTLVIALFLFIGTVIAWVYSSKGNTPPKEGTNKMLIMGFIGSVLLFGASGFLYMGAEFTGANDPSVTTESGPVNYRNLGGTNTGGTGG